MRVSPAHKRLLKEYKTIYEFQEDYPTKEKREKFVGKLRNYEIDELVNLCNNTQGKIYRNAGGSSPVFPDYADHSPSAEKMGGT